ncbi:hypothetical protein [Pseudoxanthomonas dokdonensis]|uniref:Uncharacterized protein n=1 Tax=Pseudoxanthomonas dokdonensis TaxID=344882 RepID=A0A0R0CTC0_9GAMM|nr:hypothetical protein [Pseudoxanthomonas dokdonensis]KRG69150.1 hypothetical protein ABB29_12160 [Pseudoxanthomonas dokdonensis]
MTTPKNESLPELVARWRARADAISVSGTWSGDSVAGFIRYCADDLQAALAREASREGVGSDSVLIRVYRPEGYDDVHPEILLDDLKIHPDFRPEIVIQPEPVVSGGVEQQVSTVAKLIADHVGHGMREKCEAVAMQVIAAMSEAKPQAGGYVQDVCKWSQQDEGYEVFSTSCGREFELNDGADGGVSIPFCPFCARRIEGSAWTRGDEIAAAAKTSGDAE